MDKMMDSCAGVSVLFWLKLNVTQLDTRPIINWLGDRGAIRGQLRGLLR